MPSIEVYQAWIRDGLERLGKQQVDLAKEAKLEESRLSEFMNAPKTSKTKFLTADVADRISNFLGEAVPSDFHIHAKPIQVEEVRVVGRIGRKVWEDQGDDADDEIKYVSSVKNNIYPADMQIAYEMASPSRKLELKVGDHLICVRYEKARTAPQPNDVLVYKATKDNLANFTLLRATYKSGKLDLEPLMDYGTAQDYTTPVALVIASHRTFL